MDFIDQIKQFSVRVESMKESLQTEEATKTAIIMPFFAMLGYDVFNPQEFVPEFTADVGTKKGEKVDYAIIDGGNPIILIEAKWIGENLDKHDSQLFRYFGASSAKVGILTNGLVYKFYTDLDTPNKMDLQPFLEIDISDIKEAQVAELKKFHKSNFDVETVLNSASELKYAYAFRELFAKELQNPSDDLLRLFLSDAYSGIKTQAVIDKFRPILKRALNQYVSEMMNDKIKSALSVNDNHAEYTSQADVEPENAESTIKIITTQEELEALYAVKSMLIGVLDAADITYKDTESYFTICFKGMVTKWICRLVLSGSRKHVIVPSADKSHQKFPLECIDDIFSYREVLIESAKRFVPVTIS